MENLEKKLNELGYKKGKELYVFGGYGYQYSKAYNDRATILINIENGKKIMSFRIKPTADIYSQYDISNLQYAFNQMNKDLNELK